MKIIRTLKILVLAFGLLACSSQFVGAEPMGTAFTYQGQLYDNNYPANGRYDFTFALYDADVGGSKLGTDINVADVNVIDGYSTIELDFGSGVFDGNARWLGIGIRPGVQNDPNLYTLLSPRQEVTPAPYTGYAQTAGSVVGGIIGSGTANYIPKFSDATTVGNSVIYESAGKVGIGTMSPEKKLDIASESYTDLGIGLSIKSTGGTSWDIDNDGGVFKIVEHSACGPEFINNTRIAVVGNCIGSPYGGNVGIGTTSPAELLDVNGGVKLSNTTNINAGTIRWTGIDFEGYNGTKWISLTSGGTGNGIPSGSIIMWSGSSIPAGWALCNGTNGTPDLRDRFIVGAGSSYSISNTGGEAFHTLTIDEMPPHTHSYRYWPGWNFSGSSEYGAKGNPDDGHQTGSTGGGNSHENRPPYYALAYIMKL